MASDIGRSANGIREQLKEDVLEGSNLRQLERLLKASNDSGFMAGSLRTPTHLLSIYKDMQQSGMSVANQLAHSILSIPSGVALSKFSR